MGERSGLIDRTELDTVVLELTQTPLGAYAFPTFGLIFVSFAAASFFPLARVVVSVVVLGAFLLLMTSGVYRPPLRLEIRPGQLSVQGWVGWLPLPSRIVVPTHGTTLAWRDGAEVNGVQLYVLRLTHSGRTWTLPAVRCTRDELEAVRDRLEGMQLLAGEVHGEGLGEVPEALRDLREREPPDPG